MAETKLTTTTETEPKGVMRTMTTGKKKALSTGNRSRNGYAWEELFNLH